MSYQEPTHGHPEPQIDPSDGYAYYQILDGSTLLAEIVATRHPDPLYSSGMAGGREYWRIPHDALYTLHHPSLLVKHVRRGPWPTAGAPPFSAASASFSTAVDVVWGGGATPTCHKAASADYGFDVEVALMGGTWKGKMSFYRSNGVPIFQPIPVGGAEVFTLSTYPYLQSCGTTVP